ncbi:hypothetical protein [Flavobacterium sp.]|uniref:hypothetical protein n=1 Tax=Flavobacterium sp. TaxID=239 RepID=UPI0026134CF0|nr:hypothetical protein [Flavobacterium sp.]
MERFFAICMMLVFAYWLFKILKRPFFDGEDTSRDSKKLNAVIILIVGVIAMAILAFKK